ncbi:MAG: acetoacetate--CoA ligase [Bacteroidota bacterium]
MPDTLWQPSPSFIEQSNLKDYEDWLRQQYGLAFADYHELWAWSTENPAAFWESLWKYFDIIEHEPYSEVLTKNEMPGAEWFTGATVNYAEHIFRQRSDTRPALIFQNEIERFEVSWVELEAQVAAFQAYLREKGVGEGDRVVGYLPNIPAAIVCFLAANGLGAVWSCCSPDFGVETVIERFGQIEPKILIATDGYRYNGKQHERKPEIEQLQVALETLEEVVLVPYLDEKATIEGSTLWLDILSASSTSPSIEFTPVPFHHPIWVLYSSGTTGKPKAITHSHGGVLLEHLKYLAFHNDAKPGEHFFWFTTTGWMMWNFLQASMLVGAVPVLFDGSPGYPTLNGLWQLAADLPIHHFGTSAPFLTACMKKRLKPGKENDLQHLRSIGSTGAPLPAEAFDWVYTSIGKDIWLCSMSGGTDVCTAFVGGIPYAPVYRGHIQGRALGCALYAYGEDGMRIKGSLGEMVIEQPMPSMPIYFWNDPKMERYRKSYFADFPGKWRHGDWINIFPSGSLVIHGRSDATLNRKGIRIGTAEIYGVLDKMPELKDALILNLEQSNGNDIMPLFVVLNEGFVLDEILRKKIRTELRVQCSPRHVPDHIFLAPDIPYTLSGKKMEVPVKKVLMGLPAGKGANRDAMRNPEAMDWFMNFDGI